MVGYEKVPSNFQLSHYLLDITIRQ